MNLILSVLAVILFCLQVFISTSGFIAPDFRLGQINPPQASSLIFAIIAVVFLVIFFAISFINEQKLSKYLLKTLASSFFSFLIPTIGLFCLSFYLDSLRCQQSGFCVGGEHYDHMSTIFLIIILVPLGISSSIATVILALILRFFNQLKNEEVSFASRVTLLSLMAIFLTSEVLKFRPNLNTLFEYNSPIQKTLMQAMTKCQPYDHCGEEVLDVQEIIDSVKGKNAFSQMRLTNFQRWSIALGAMTVEMNRMPHDQLSIIPPQRYSEDLEDTLVKNMLRDWWDITDRGSAINILSWLANSGHSGDQYRFFYVTIKDNPLLLAEELYNKNMADYKAVNGNDPVVDVVEKPNQIRAYNFVLKNIDKTGNNLIYAWDYGRFVFVARSAYSVGFLTQAEALTLIEEVGKRVKNRFSSWQEFSDNYITGRLWWAPDQVGIVEETELLRRKLTAPSGTWTKIPWEWSENN